MKKDLFITIDWFSIFIYITKFNNNKKIENSNKKELF